MSFVNLHVHSEFSLRDSIIRKTEIVQRLKEINQNAIAITDHGNSLGGISIYKTLKAEGLKYIHGCELYICEDVSIKDKNSRYNHLVLLCENEEGRLNLNKLMSISEQKENYYYKPRIDFNILKQYSEGIICLSACMAGEISKALELNTIEGYTNAQQIALKYKDLFRDNYYLEIQSHRDAQQEILNHQIYALGKELNIPVVVTTDAHYSWEEDKKYQNKYAFNGAYKEDGEAYIDCYIQSEEDVIRILTLQSFSSEQISEMIKNTETIANKCNVNMPISAPIMPHVETPKEFKNSKDWLYSLCEQGFKAKLNVDIKSQSTYDLSRKLHKDIYDDFGEFVETIEYNLSKEEIKTHYDRFLYELDSLDRMGFIDYILLVYSYSNIAERRGIARGSGGGSIICYLSNITNIDPIQHGLYFERFIDVGALDGLENGTITKSELKIPDIDLDFGSDSCQQVLQYIYEQYGENKVASIGKFGTNQTKGTIRDMCKVFEFDLQQEDMIAKSFGEHSIEDIDMMINGDIPKLKGTEEAIKYVLQYPELFEYVRKLNGLPKSFGLHACGKIISVQDLDFYLPSCYDKNGIRYLQGDMHDVEDVGLVKVDILGLRTLDQEFETLELSKESVDFIDPKQSFADKKVLEIFNQGLTTGIFQMASYGMRETLKKMNVNSIDDLSIANALYRPGAMAYIDNYCNRKQGKESFEYLHEDLKPILESTYGIIVFQEQLIEIGRLAQIKNPDLLRKATGKKDVKLLNSIQPELKGKLLARGWSEAQFNILWADMLEFAKYSFNKSHSSSYAIIAYMTAKQKAYYPKEFFAGLCNSYIGHNAFIKDKVADIISEMERFKIKFNTLSFRNDHRKCHVENGKINYAIPLIRDCSIAVGEALFKIKDKQYNYFYHLLLDLLNLDCQDNQIKVLIKLGFFAEFGNTKELLHICEILKFFGNGKTASINKKKVQGDLEKIVQKHSIGANDKGKEYVSYKIQNIDLILQECEQMIKDQSIEDFDLKFKIADQMKYLGFLSATGVQSDRPILYVKKLHPMKRKKDGVYCGDVAITQSIGSGIVSCFTVFEGIQKKCDKLEQDCIIRIFDHHTKDGYFYMDNYEIIG